MMKPVTAEAAFIGPTYHRAAQLAIGRLLKTNLDLTASLPEDQRDLLQRLEEIEQGDQGPGAKLNPRG